MIQQPRIPSSGLMPASDVLIRAQEVSQICFWYITFFSSLGMTNFGGVIFFRMLLLSSNCM